MDVILVANLGAKTYMKIFPAERALISRFLSPLKRSEGARHGVFICLAVLISPVRLRRPSPPTLQPPKACFLDNMEALNSAFLQRYKEQPSSFTAGTERQVYQVGAGL